MEVKTGILPGGAPSESALCLAVVPPEAWIQEGWSRIINAWSGPDDTYKITPEADVRSRHQCSF